MSVLARPGVPGDPGVPVARCPHAAAVPVSPRTAAVLALASLGGLMLG